MRGPGMYVVVSGAPGSGKTTLGRALAERLGLPLLSKDTFKEALMGVLDVPDVETSRRVGLAAIRAMYAVAVDARCGVLDCVWRPELAVAEIGELPGAVVEVFCRCPTAVAKRRYADRAAERSAGHFDAERLGDDLWGAGAGAGRPIGGPWPVVEVDTTVRVDVGALGDQVAAHADAGRRVEAVGGLLGDEGT